MTPGRSTGTRWAFLALLGSSSLAAQPIVIARLADLSLEELGNIAVTSVSKRAESLSGAPTSVFVITAADIRRSGATSLPEALRLAPNLQVARINAYNYSITARGFNSQSANKLLVLIDGRSVYTPLFSGVFWDAQEVLLEDVERIEVISGPGGTLWGVNAVNGVINIISRSASDSQGTLLAVGGGNRQARASARFGSADFGIVYKLHATHSRFCHGEIEAGTPVDDAARQSQVGFGVERQSGDDKFSIRGAAYSGRHDQARPGSIVTGAAIALAPISFTGSHVLALWQRQLDAGAGITVQAYYDRTERSVRPTFTDTQGIVDLQFTHALDVIGAHTPVWGAEYRRGRDRVDNSIYISILPDRLEQTWASLFAQDEIALGKDLRLTLGARVERNDYTGAEFLPNVRLAWQWAPNQLLWTAASRTVRAPSRLDRDFFVPVAPGSQSFVLRGGPDVVSELANSYELGWRGQITPRASLSATVYHTDYKRLRTQQVFRNPTFVQYSNDMAGSVAGLEMWGSLQALPNWRLHAGFSRMVQHLHLDPVSNDTTAVARTEGANPARWWSLRSSFDLGSQLEWDVIVRHVGTLARPLVPSYTALDMRIGWQLRPGIELSLSGYNLTGDGHGEFTDVITRAHFKRAAFASLEMRL